MSTIEPYLTSQGDGEAPKGSASNPYTFEECEAMLNAGTWTGGYVVGYGFIKKEIVINGSVISSDETSDSSDDSSDDPSDGLDFSDSDIWGSDDDPIDPSDDNLNPGNDNDFTGGNDGGSNNEGNGRGASGGDTFGGGTGSGSGSGSGSNSNTNVDNDGEIDNSSQYTYTEERASELMNQGKWQGGYVIGLGYVGPCVTIVSSNVNHPVSGIQILENALEFMNVPYKFGGCDLHGIDCSGLVSVALRISRWTTDSGDIPGMNKIVLTNRNGQFINELQKGDILVWRKGSGHANGHAAIYVEGTKIFHAHGKTGTPTGYTNDLIRHWYNNRGIPDVYRK